MTFSFYQTIIQARNDSQELQQCIQETIHKLRSAQTEVDRPGMLLGKIQSGKTRAFIGIIALGGWSTLNAIRRFWVPHPLWLSRVR